MTQLKLDPRNARRHSDRNKRQIKKSLETIGAGRSILADADGIVRAGNGVFAEWGDKPIKIVQTTGQELVVVQRTDLRGQDAIRAAALDNLVADSSAFDYDAAILAEIARDDDVIRAIANEDAKLRELLRKENGNGEKVDPGELIDKAAQLQEKWQVRRGDVWQVGKHRLMCGDSTSKEDVERLMDGKRAQAVVTDPPFGVRDDRWDTFSGDEDFINSTARWLEIGKQHADAIVCFMADKNVPSLLVAMARAGLEYRRALIWQKPPGSQFAGASLDGFWYDFEIIQVFGKPNFKPRKDTRMAVLSHRTVTDQEHGCEKPVPLLVDLVEGYAEQANAVIDLFTGTGATLVACEQTGRFGYGMELEPKYCAVSLERLANLGLQPQRLGSQITGI